MSIVHDFLADLRYGLRLLRNAPGFTAVAVLTLAIGVGANTAVFSIVDGLWLRPLPVDDAKHLVVIYTSERTQQGTRLEGDTSFPDLVDYRAGAPAFAGIAGTDRRGSLLRVGDDSVMLLTAVVTENYFSVLRVNAARGRVFTEQDFRGSEVPHEVVISHSLWQKHFGGDPGLVGRTVRLTSRDYTVVGILPKQFRGTELPTAPDVYIPTLVWGREELVDRGYAHFSLIARLRPGADLRQAQQQLESVARHLAAEYPKERAGRVVTARWETDTRETAPAALFLGIAGLVLLIACANVATLLMARGETRRREIATRLALGGTRGRVVRQLLTESFLLALAGMAVAVVVAFWIVRALPGLLPPDWTAFGIDFRLDYRAVRFAAVAALASMFFFGTVPALLSYGVSLVSELKEGGAAGTSRARAWGRNMLVVVQVALSVVLLAGATLLVRSFINAARQDLGFDSGAQALIVKVLPGRSPSAPKFADTHPQLLERIAAIPGVEAAGVGNRPPFGDNGTGWRRIVYVPGMPLGPTDRGVPINISDVDGGYFRAVGMRLLRGRTFGTPEPSKSRRVAIVNETAARRLFPRSNAVGEHFRFGGPDGKDCEVVGVVRDAKYNGVTEHTQPYIYVPLWQEDNSDTALIIRTRVAPGSVLPAVRRAIKSFDADMTIFGTATMSEHMRAALYSQRTVAQLVVVLGLFGMALAVVGLYGVLAYYVNRRRHEIGVRMAIGAEAGALFRMVVRRGLVLATIGVIVGIGGALAITRLLSGLLFGVSPRDPLALAIVAAGLLIVTLVAAAVPARRATKIDPIAALRYE